MTFKIRIAKKKNCNKNLKKKEKLYDFEEYTRTEKYRVFKPTNRHRKAATLDR